MSSRIHIPARRSGDESERTLFESSEEADERPLMQAFLGGPVGKCGALKMWDVPKKEARDFPGFLPVHYCFFVELKFNLGIYIMSK